MKSYDAAAQILRDIEGLACPEILIIVPPFAGLDRPNLGVHILQAIAQKKGVKLGIFYANAILAKELGPKQYLTISNGPTIKLHGESVFAKAAFGSSYAKHECTNKHEALSYKRAVDSYRNTVPDDILLQLQLAMPGWVDRITALIAEHPFKVIGCTSTFEQTCASMAFLNRIKAIRPDITTIMGGANCEGHMGEAIGKLCPDIDFVFSGESEATFENFLDYLKGIAIKPDRIIYGNPNPDLNTIPPPDYTQFYRQLEICSFEDQASLNNSLWLPYETSRGCWWGQRHHCPFCGLNDQGIKYRQKSPELAIKELSNLLLTHPSKQVLMVDYIMPQDYFRTLLPELEAKLPGLHIYYQMKANLTLAKLRALADSGIKVIQPGIEALSSDLLSLMGKGVSAIQNVNLLRYAASVDVSVTWNFLYGFPGDHDEWYSEVLRLLPYLVHLSPPVGLSELSIDRFSPYFEQAAEFGLTNVQPFPAYYDVFPVESELHNLAYHFTAEYESGSLKNPAVIQELEDEVARWRRMWESGSAPKLFVNQLDSESYFLLDTRGLPGNPEIESLTANRASIVLAGTGDEENSELDIQWALKRGYCIEMENKIVPLAIAPPELFDSMEQKNLRRHPATHEHSVLISSTTRGDDEEL
jgi:ribosomal peptide maturation radical SAM protein 1